LLGRKFGVMPAPLVLLPRSWQTNGVLLDALAKLSSRLLRTHPESMQEAVDASLRLYPWTR